MERRKIAVIEEIVMKLNEAPQEEPVEQAAPIEEAVVEQPVEPVYEEPIEEAAAEVPAEVAVTEAVPEAEKKARKPVVPFPTKIINADEVIQDRYNELKNYVMRYKKIKSRLSKKFDSVNLGRIQYVKFGLAGRTLKMYFNLNIENVEPKFHAKDVAHKKLYTAVPVMLRIKSGRAVRYAKKMIDQAAEGIPLKLNKKFVETDYIAALEEAEQQEVAATQNTEE